MHIVECDQYSPTYFEAHRGIPSASRFGDICTPAKGDYSASSIRYIYDLVAQRFDPLYGMFESYQTAAMKTGVVMEPAARRFYEFERDCEVRRVGFVTTDDGRLGCSPDALVGDDGGLELKSPNLATHVKYLADGALPIEYRPQVHGSLIVTGRDYWDFMSFSPFLPPLLVRVAPDEFTRKLRAALDRFLGEYDKVLAAIQAKLPPPPAPEIIDVPGLGQTQVTVQDNYF